MFKIVDNGFFMDLCKIGSKTEVLASKMFPGDWFHAPSPIREGSTYDRILKTNGSVKCPLLRVRSLSEDEAESILSVASISVPE